VRFYWSNAKNGDKYLGDDSVANVIFFKEKDAKDCFFVEIMLFYEKIKDEKVARVRWCEFWNEGSNQNPRPYCIHKEYCGDEGVEKLLMGETYIRI
jgi:hypothetical protein